MSTPEHITYDELFDLYLFFKANPQLIHINPNEQGAETQNTKPKEKEFTTPDGNAQQKD